MSRERSRSRSRSPERESKRDRSASPVRNNQGAKFESVDSARFPIAFQCESGVLLWGHLNTVIKGSTADSTDLPQGDIKYRAAAKSGRWLVQSVELDGERTGFVCHHEASSPVEVFKQAAAVGDSPNPAVPRVGLIGRYEMGWPDGSDPDPDDALIRNTIRAEESEDPPNRLGFLILDSNGYSPFIRALKDDKFSPEDDTYQLVNRFTRQTFGAHLTTGGEVEEEWGWLVFDPAQDVIIGFVYDGSQTMVFQGEGEVTVGGQVVNLEAAGGDGGGGEEDGGDGEEEEQGEDAEDE